MTEKVLIIEDDIFHQKLLTEILTNSGYEVITAGDGLEGLKKVYSYSPSIVLVDYALPNLNGLEIIKEIRKNALLAHLPIIMITATATSDTQVLSYEAGVDDYVTKPFNSIILSLKIRNLLDKQKTLVSLNPLTQFPGSYVLHKKIEEKIKNGEKFSVLYSDIDNFKPYNDYYGFKKGDEVIKFFSEMLKKIVDKYGSSVEAFHIGGDDFVLICPVDKAEIVGNEIVKNFDNDIKNFYSPEDLQKGGIVVEDRDGKVRSFGIMTISVAGTDNVRTPISNFGEISKILAELKHYAKSFPKSIFVMNRRTRI